MSDLMLAVDAGGTSTRGVLLDRAGRCLGYGRGASGNPTSVGVDAAAASMASSAAEALAHAGVAGDHVDSVLLAMAGSTTTSPLAALRRELAGHRIEAPIAIEGDLLAMYFSGTPLASGYVLVAGTGAAAIRVEDGRQAAVADGLGWLLGDDGSGFWIGRRVVRAALADLDGRAPATRLTDLLVERLGLATGGGPAERHASMHEALRILYAERPVHLAHYAPLAFEAAAGDSPDPTAGSIVSEAAAALAHTLSAVAVEGLPGPIVLGGGILTHQPALADRVVALVAGDGDGPAPEVASVSDGVVGAAALALRRAGVVVDEDVFARLGDSLALLR